MTYFMLHYTCMFSSLRFRRKPVSVRLGLTKREIEETTTEQWRTKVSQKVTKNWTIFSWTISL